LSAQRAHRIPTVKIGRPDTSHCSLMTYALHLNNRNNRLIINGYGIFGYVSH
jgi:hypothetical protein